MKVLGPLVLAGWFAACGSGDDDEDVLVFAAASLTEAFSDLGEAYEASTGAAIDLNFAGSSELAAQIEAGAPAAVFAAADEVSAERVAAHAAGAPLPFATNEMVLAVEPGNPADVRGVEALADDELIVVVCAVEVPCGRYAQQVAANAGIAIAADSYEANVKGVVTKVALGEADLGVVYRTDAVAAGDEVEAVEVAPDVNVEAVYPLVLLDGAGDDAEDFVRFVLGPEGRALLADHGFGAP